MKKESIISIGNGILLIAVFVLALSDTIRFPLIFSYTWHKILHILGTVLFFGNMVSGPVWVSYAFFSKDPKIIDFSFKLLRITDVSLTITGLDLLILNGLCLSSVFGGLKAQAWIYHSVILMFVMWGLSIPVIFIQEKLYQAHEEGGNSSPQFKKYLVLWSIFGTLVTIPPSIIFYLMIAKTT
ncbi:MAG: DUF2269 family protein [Leptospiraceae bacterium]|nr:DUF2269 family protein [Leptospiraceae bacterium]